MSKVDFKIAKKQLELKVPADLNRVLKATLRIEAIWKNLTPIARRDFISWINSAKQSDTRKSRIERIPNMLASGKRRPCCYAIVPMNVYKALGSNLKAKAQWGNLTPIERRDFISWIELAKELETRKSRIEKVCNMLVLGKRHP